MPAMRTRDAEAAARETAIALLAFPRALARGDIALEQCPHAGHHAPPDPRCAVCRSRLECEWLSQADESSAVAERALPEVLAALRFAAVYVESRVALSRHPRAGCPCAACRWLGEANALLGEWG